MDYVKYAKICFIFFISILHLNCQRYAENRWWRKLFKWTTKALIYGSCIWCLWQNKINITANSTKMYQNIFPFTLLKKVDIGSGNGSVAPRDTTQPKPILKKKTTDTLLKQDIICLISKRVNNRRNITAILSISQYVTCFMIPNSIKLLST